MRHATKLLCLIMPLCTFQNSATFADEGQAAKDALEACFMESALRYTVSTCESAETIYTAAVGGCIEERKTFERLAFSSPEYQAIPYSRRETLIDQFVAGYRPIIFNFVLEGRAQSGKVCN